MPALALDSASVRGGEVAVNKRIAEPISVLSIVFAVGMVLSSLPARLRYSLLTLSTKPF
jgi:hypothetical protein